MGLYLLSRGPHCESPWTNGQITSGQWRLGSRGTRSYQERGSRRTTFIGPSPLYFTTVSLSLSLCFSFLYQPSPARFCTIPLPESSATLSPAPEKRIRRYTSLPEIFLSWLFYLSLPEKPFRGWNEYRGFQAGFSKVSKGNDFSFVLMGIVFFLGLKVLEERAWVPLCNLLNDN